MVETSRAVPPGQRFPPPARAAAMPRSSHLSIKGRHRKFHGARDILLAAGGNRFRLPPLPGLGPQAP